MTLSIHSFRRLALGSTYHGARWLIWNQQSSTRCGPERTDNFSTLSSSYLEKKTQRIILLVATTRLVKKLLTWCWTEFGSSQTIALVCKGSWCSTPWAEAPVLG